MRIVLLAAGTVRASLTARLVHLGRELAGSGHEVFLIAPTFDKYSQFQPETVTSYDGITIVRPKQWRIKQLYLSLLPYFFSATLALWRLRPDMVHLYKPTPVTIFGLLARLRGVPVVLDMDDLGNEVMKRNQSPAWVVVLTAWCERLAARWANGIVVVSTFLRDRYKAQYPHTPIIWVPNGVRSVRQTAVAEHPQLVFIGSLDTMQIVEPLIKALPRVVQALPMATLQIIGDGSCRAALEKLAQELGMSDAITWRGHVPNEQLTGLVHAGDIGYSCVPDEPTYRAASSQKVFDYMALGILPLVNAVGDLPTYVGDAGYVVGDHDVANGLTLALTDTTRTARSKKAQQRVRQNYLWSDLAGQVVNFYQQLQGAKS